MSSGYNSQQVIGLFLHYNYCFSDGVVMILREFFVTSALLVSNFYHSPSPFNHLNANSKKKKIQEETRAQPICQCVFDMVR
jgi:hypothetical protein